MNRWELLRYERGLTQQELADSAGVSLRTVIRLERSVAWKPNAAVAHALAQYYGITVAELLDPQADPAPHHLDVA